VYILDLSAGVTGKGRTFEALKYLVLHHTATGSNADPKNIVYRGDRVYPNPYHYLVDLWGRIYKTRPLIQSGICVAGKNTQSVCIAGIGNWNEEDITTPAFLKALSWLCALLIRSYNLRLVCHRDLYPTECPGRYFPFDRITWEVDKLLNGV